MWIEVLMSKSRIVLWSASSILIGTNLNTIKIPEKLCVVSAVVFVTQKLIVSLTIILTRKYC